MKEILIFAGTTEGRKLSECLSEAGISHTICVATEYGELVLKENPLMKIHCGRMNREEIRGFIESGSFMAVVDATHPYADAVTENIKAAMDGLDIPYLRLKRELSDVKTDERVIFFDTNEECAKALRETEGNILLTTGSKELSKYCAFEDVKSRLFVRVLPAAESLSICIEQGIRGKQLIAMQGPFTAEMNKAMINQYGISCLVTKKSGMSGGYIEKLEAAEKAGISVFVIGPKGEDKGYSFGQLCKELEGLCGKKIQTNTELQIILAGVGMGNKNSLTVEARKAIEEADIILGAKRMIKDYKPRLEKKPFYLAEQIIPYLKEMQEKELGVKNFSHSENSYTKDHSHAILKVVILFSGDTGFYSGCQGLYSALQEEVDKGQLKASVRIMPGISSVAYLAACIGESYHDAAIYSIHGKELHNLAKRISTEHKTYILMSDVKDVNKLGRILSEADLNQCEVIAGYMLSYPEQKLLSMTPKECISLKEEGLYTCLVKNPNAIHKGLAHGIADGEFIRDRVPMTKEEVREVSICKLKLYQGAVVYDIGSGTGSVAVEMAGLSSDIQVYAIEQKKEAASLVEQNKEKFQLENITVIETKAPKGLKELPKATHAFIGGSGGNLREILQTLYDINPHMRVVINAVSMETICEIKQILYDRVCADLPVKAYADLPAQSELYQIENEEIVQIQVNRARTAGAYHLMQAENPVWICAFNFCKQL